MVIGTMFSLLVERRDWFLELLVQHIVISLVAVVIAIGIGLVLGIAIAQWRRGAKPVLTLVNFVYTIPSIALFGFLIPVTGIGDMTAIVALTVYALLPMVRNTYTGLTTIDPALIEAARGMGSTTSQLLRRIELPLAAPHIMSGIRTMTIMTIALAGIASFIGAGGLGVAIYRGITTNNLAMTLAGSVLIAVLAIVVDLVLGRVERATRRHLEPVHSRTRRRLLQRKKPKHAAPSLGTPKQPTPSNQEGRGARARAARPAGAVGAVYSNKTVHFRRPRWKRSTEAAVGVLVAVTLLAGGAFVLTTRDGGPGNVASFFPTVGPGDGSAGTISVATKPMTEQYILGEMITTLVEHNTNLDVELTQGIGGGTANIQPGIEKGDFDLYPEYTGTGWNAVLKHEGTYQESLFNQMNDEYQRDLGLIWLGMYGFNNTFGLAVSKHVADAYDLHTYSDLAAVADELTLGAEPDFFDRQDGYAGLQSTYGMNFSTARDMDISLKYQALFDGQVDAIVISTTDAQAADDRLVVLEDDKTFYPSYVCGNVVRLDTLQAHPELRDELLKLEGTITNAEMSRMNQAVETQGKEPKEVADAFLSERGLV